jgi:serine protease AprX
MRNILAISLLLIASNAFAQDDPGTGLHAMAEGDSIVITRKAERASLTISPNPFTMTTNIEFTLKKDAVVTLEVFDIGGRIIRSYEIAEPLKAGSYSYPFDSSKLRPGVYLCRLNCGGKITMKKMVRAK